VIGLLGLFTLPAQPSTGNGGMVSGRELAMAAALVQPPEILRGKSDRVEAPLNGALRVYSSPMIGQSLSIAHPSAIPVDTA